MTSYFAYERSFDCHWQPVVYHNSKPSKSVNQSEPERTALYEIPAELMGSDGQSPEFGKIMIMFPAPKNYD